MSHFPTFLTKNSKNFKNPFFGFLTAKILIILAILSQISFCFAHGEKKMRLFLGLVSCPNCIPYFSMQNMTRTELHSTYFPAVVRIIASQLLSLFHLLELPILLMFSVQLHCKTSKCFFSLTFRRFEKRMKSNKN